MTRPEVDSQLEDPLANRLAVAKISEPHPVKPRPDDRSPPDVFQGIEPIREGGLAFLRQTQPDISRLQIHGAIVT